MCLQYMRIEIIIYGQSIKKSPFSFGSNFIEETVYTFNNTSNYHCLGIQKR